MTRLRVTAPEVVPRDQPNSCSSGSRSAPVEERKPAAATSAAIVAAATHQARTRGARLGHRSSAHRPSLGTVPGRRPPGGCRNAPGSRHHPCRDRIRGLASVHGRHGPPRIPQGHRHLAGPGGAVRRRAARAGDPRAVHRPGSPRCTWSPPRRRCRPVPRSRSSRPTCGACARWPGPRKPGVPMARQRGIVAAYDNVLTDTAQDALAVPTNLAELPRGHRPGGRAAAARARARGRRAQLAGPRRPLSRRRLRGRCSSPPSRCRAGRWPRSPGSRSPGTRCRRSPGCGPR